MTSLASFWADGWCRKYQNVCWQPKGLDAECIKVAIRFAHAFKRELLNRQGCQTNAGLSVADSPNTFGGGVTAGETAPTEYRYECLCQKCWRQFELPHKDAPHICPSCTQDTP